MVGWVSRSSMWISRCFNFCSDKLQPSPIFSAPPAKSIHKELSGKPSGALLNSSVARRRCSRVMGTEDGPSSSFFTKWEMVRYLCAWMVTWENELSSNTYVKWCFDDHHSSLSFRIAYTCTFSLWMFFRSWEKRRRIWFKCEWLLSCARKTYMWCTLVNWKSQPRIYNVWWSWLAFWALDLTWLSS